MLLVGNVQNVIEGKATEEHWLDATSFAYAFEIGSPLGIQTMGEMVAMNGWAYCKEPKNGTLMIGDRFVTTAAMVIPHEAKPAYQQDIYAFKEKCAFAGIIHCEVLRGTAISKAPIYGGSLSYDRPPVELHDVWIAVVGASGDLPGVTYGENKTHSHVLVLDQEVDHISKVTPKNAKDVLHLFPSSIIGKVSLDIYPINELTPF